MRILLLPLSARFIAYTFVVLITAILLIAHFSDRSAGTPRFLS